MTQAIKKYPRTQHVQSSRLQQGDEDLDQVPFASLLGKRLIVEEKVDGANCGISFDTDGKMLLQSRGHFLTGGPREKHWTLFKQWAAAHEEFFFDTLGQRYICYGEWMFAKHTVFYDLLPHYFMEFDIYDRESDAYLGIDERRSLLWGGPVKQVLVLHDGPLLYLDDLTQLVRPSYFKTGRWKSQLHYAADRAGVKPELAVSQTDASSDMEGLYIKVEEGGIVKERLKWVRPTFCNAILDSETHWLDRPIIPNMLAPGTDIFRK